MKPPSFFSELKRRNVYKVTIAYAVVSWLLIQVATQVFPFFEIPNWAVRLVVLLLVIGFPIAFILGWAFELTPEGIKRTEELDQMPQQQSKNRAWIYVVIVAGAISIGLFFLERYTDAYRNELEAFLKALEDGSPMPTIPRDGRQALRLADCALQSVSTGCTVKV